MLCYLVHDKQVNFQSCGDFTVMKKITRIFFLLKNKVFNFLKQLANNNKV